MRGIDQHHDHLMRTNEAAKTDTMRVSVVLLKTAIELLRIERDRLQARP